MYVSHQRPPIISARPLQCTVLCERSVLIGVLTGQFELTAALMSGQMSSDSFSSMMAFKRAFKFDKSSWEEYRALKEARAGAEIPRQSVGAAR